MLPGYTFIIDILDKKGCVPSEEQFSALVDPCLSYLKQLSVSVDRKPGIATYFLRPDTDEQSECLGYSARYEVMHSLGHERAQGLIHTFEAIVRLLQFELPHLKIVLDVEKFES